MKDLIFLLSFFVLCACGQNNYQSELTRHVGDIPLNPELDTAYFSPCHEDLILQYYYFGKGIQYEGEKAALVAFVRNEFSANSIDKDNGYVTVRFIVNCKGESGRFRVIELDNNYDITTHSEVIVNQITDIVRRLDGWKAGTLDGSKAYDYYQYLTFKISNGQITDIMP
jgi:hypothetical protein